MNVAVSPRSLATSASLSAIPPSATVAHAAADRPARHGVVPQREHAAGQRAQRDRWRRPRGRAALPVAERRAARGVQLVVRLPARAGGLPALVLGAGGRGGGAGVAARAGAGHRALAGRALPDAPHAAAAPLARRRRGHPWLPGRDGGDLP